MKEYPATSRHFKIGNKTHTMMKLTLGLQAKIEDGDIEVTKRDIVVDCTDLSKEELDTLHLDQFQSIYEDVIALSYGGETSGSEDGDGKKQ